MSMRDEMAKLQWSKGLKDICWQSHTPIRTLTKAYMLAVPFRRYIECPRPVT